MDIQLHSILSTTVSDLEKRILQIKLNYFGVIMCVPSIPDFTFDEGKQRKKV